MTLAGQAGADPGDLADVRLMVRAAQLYYRQQLTQAVIGERLGLSRFAVGRLLDRAVRDGIVRIEIADPVARLVELEDALVARFGLRRALVVDAASDLVEGAEQAARVAVARGAAALLADERPAGVIGVSWGRSMLALAEVLEPGWTTADEVVELNGATSRSTVPTRATEIVERFAVTTGASVRLLPAPAVVGTAELRQALVDDPAVRSTIEAGRLAPTAVFSLGVLTRASVLVESGCLADRDVDELEAAGAVGDVLGRFLTVDGRVASRALDDRAVGLPLADLAAKPFALGLAAGPGRGPIALAALRAGCVNALAADEATAAWVLAHA